MRDTLSNDFDSKIRIKTAAFEMADGVSEYQVIVEGIDPILPYSQQVERIFASLNHWLLNRGKGFSIVFLRCFLSDIANQKQLLMERLNTILCAQSIIEQCPLNGTKISLWAYIQSDVEVSSLPTGLIGVRHGAYEHLWGGMATVHAPNSEEQTRILLNDYCTQLAHSGCALSKECIRTWFYVHDVDSNYSGVVKARNEVFETQNLTSQTHYIASTGIGGSSPDSKSLVQMDTYAVKGLQSEQIQFLYAKSHLNPTDEYGVSFERGVCVKYGDRRHVFISGTASIDHKGEILYPGNITKQTFRMWENVEVLLQEANASYHEVGMMLIYLRDPADYHLVQKLYDERFPEIPKVILLAPVCRPGWLIEMECIAFVKEENPTFPVL